MMQNIAISFFTESKLQRPFKRHLSNGSETFVRELLWHVAFLFVIILWGGKWLGATRESRDIGVSPSLF